MQSSTSTTGTKMVEVRMSALIRVEHTEVVEVPDNITAEELQHLVNDRYRKVDGGTYVQDTDYWERGTCYATDAEQGAQPDLLAFRVDGGMHIEAAEQVERQREMAR